MSRGSWPQRGALAFCPCWGVGVLARNVRLCYSNKHPIQAQCFISTKVCHSWDLVTPVSVPSSGIQNDEETLTTLCLVSLFFLAHFSSGLRSPSHPRIPGSCSSGRAKIISSLLSWFFRRLFHQSNRNESRTALKDSKTENPSRSFSAGGRDRREGLRATGILETPRAQQQW